MKRSFLLGLAFTFLALVSCKKEDVSVKATESTNYEIISIGNWDMDNTSGVIVGLSGVDVSSIISVDVEILSDDGSKTNLFSSGNYIIDGSNMYLTRDNAGYFDQSAFDDGSMNRGYVRLILNN